MGQQDVDENTSWWDRSLTDDRPHRDIFSNQYKDFEKTNTKIMTSDNEAIPEFNILKSEMWDDATP